MDTATYSMTAQAMGENPGDDGLLVRFFLHPVEDSTASQKEGRPVFNDREHIEIKVPGNRRSGVARIARQRDIDRFPRHYAAFKNRIDGDGIEGTPLSEWTMVPRSLVEEFAYFNIKTVEHLSSVSDTHALSHPSMSQWREKASAFLERAAEEAGGQALEAVQNENAQLKSQLEELQEKVAELIAKQESEED